MAELMAMKELAAYLRVSVSTIKRMLKQGELPGFQVGASWRFDPAAIDSWIKHARRAGLG